MCLTDPNVLIPAYKIKLEDENGETNILKLTTITYNNYAMHEESISLNCPVEPEVLTPPSPPAMPKPINPMTLSIDVSSFNSPVSSFNSPLPAVPKPLNSSTPFIQQHDTPLHFTEHDQIIDSTPNRNFIPEKENITMLENECVIEVKPADCVDKGKVSSLLEKLFGHNELIDKYDLIRKKFKTNNTTYKVDFERASAEIEVKLVILKTDLKEQLKKVEVETFMQSNKIAVKPVEGGSKLSYEDLINKLKIIKTLSRHFKIT